MSTSTRSAPTLSTSEIIIVWGSAWRYMRAVNQVDPKNAERLLFRQVLFVPQADVGDDLRRFLARLLLEADARASRGRRHGANNCAP